MGIDRASLTERQRELLDPEARKELGLKSASERHQRLERTLERQEQNLFRGWLERNQYAYYTSGTHKPTSANLGVADFLVPAYRLAIEFKCPGNKLSVEQEEWRRRHEARGGIYQIAQTYSQAVAIIESYGKTS